MNLAEQGPAATQRSTPDQRRYDVDALRVILFGLLIWQHYVSLFSWTQEPVPPRTNTVAASIISVMHQWRLASLFVISGMGTAFAFGRRTWQTYLSERVVRLLVPLLFATYVLLGGWVKPIDTTSRFFEIFPGIGRMPYGHLWFIYNLLIYSVVLTPLFVYVRRNPEGRLIHGLRTLLNRPLAVGLLIVPPLLFTVSDVLFKPWVRGEVGMWWEFPRYFLYFAVGYLLTSAREEYFAALERMRWALVALTVVMTLVYVNSASIFGVPDLAIGGWVKQGHPAFSLWTAEGVFALELHAWVWCLLIFAWAAKLLNWHSRGFEYLNQAVYCSYIVHFTMALLAAAIVYRLRLGYASGLIVGLVVQTLLCLAFFELAKRSRLGQVLFGIKVPTVAAANQTASVWQRRFAGGICTAGLCCVVFALVVFAWPIGGRHFVWPQANSEGSAAERETADRNGDSRQSITDEPHVRVEMDPAVRALVQASCIRCHDSNTETSLDFETLSADLKDPQTFRRWATVYDRASTRTMPPESETRPDSDVLAAALTALDRDLAAHSRLRQQTSGRVPARRLTKEEYKYTLQDLLAIDGNVTDQLPDETDSGSFDTVGSTQRLSAIHVEGFLRAAEEALGLAISLGANPFRERVADFANSENLRYFDDKRLHEGGNTLRRLDEGVAIFVDNDYLIHSGRLGMGVDVPGTYRITAKLEAIQAKQPVTCKIIRKRPDGVASVVKLADLEPGPAEVIEADVYLKPGDNFYVTLQNEDSASVYLALAVTNVEKYAGAGLAIRSLALAGPMHPQWPPESTRNLLRGVELVTSADGNTTEIRLVKPVIEHVREIVGEFAQRAFRRPVKGEELEPFVQLALPAIDEGLPFDEVVRIPLRAVLCSPQFLMFAGQPGELDAYSLASRLSYFLWKTLPDRELLDAASRGALTSDAQLERQVDRMLEDSRSQRFVNDFVGQWLRVDQVNATLPDTKLYPEFDEPLGYSIPLETQLFVSGLIAENVPLTRIIDSNYAWVNRRLARHYGLADIKGQHFRKVDLPPGSPRGGVLTQATILKTTANGTVTSPVNRGNFVLSNILGTPPPSPPPGVGSIEPDTRGQTTIREILLAHREDESCNACHRMIDPPGFALECFDPIGGLRTHYRASGAGNGLLSQFRQATYHRGPAVDASGEMPDGGRFSDITEFKKLLLRQKVQIARNFVSRLIVYSTGGEIEYADRQPVEEILGKTEADDFPVRDLIHAVVQSRLFREE